MFITSLANLVVMLTLVVQMYICKPSCCKCNLFYPFLGQKFALVYIHIPIPFSPPGI